MSPRKQKPPEGCIIKRNDGRYEGRYKDADGKRRSVYSPTYAGCLDKLLKAIKRRDDQYSGYGLVSWLKEYIEVYKRGTVVNKTYEQMLADVRLHIEPNFDSNLELEDIKPMHIQKLLNSIERPRTRESVYNLLSGALRQAYAERMIDFNPMLAVKSVKSRRKKGAALTVDEQKDFLQALSGHKLELYYLFVLYSGCRRCEALDTCREDIDELAGVIHIRGTKTIGSDRYIPLFDTIKQLLPSLPSSGKLFDFLPDYVSKQFGKLVPGHRLHDLRHTFATRALEAGVPMKVVQMWLGHTEIATTMDIYSEVSRRLSLEQAYKLNSAFGTPNYTYNAPPE